jgi:membrane protein YqaA with SNARE-associated domain
MKHLARLLYAVFIKLGGPGLLALGVLDSSFLFAPLGNDLLVVALSARGRSIPLAVYYAGMSTVGSVLGCMLVDVIFRRAGEKGLEKHLSTSRREYVKRKVGSNMAWTLVLASIMPPPFPFTPFIMAASALQYPLRKMLTVVAAARMVRFTAIGVLACFFGRRILRWADQPAVQIGLVVLTIFCIVGSVISVYGWIARSRQPSTKPSTSRYYIP